MPVEVRRDRDLGATKHLMNRIEVTSHSEGKRRGLGLAAESIRAEHEITPTADVWRAEGHRIEP